MFGGGSKGGSYSTHVARVLLVRSTSIYVLQFLVRSPASNMAVDTMHQLYMAKYG